MNDRIKYEAIKDAVEYGFDEYMNEENLDICQATAKILEEDWREVNYNIFTKASYFLNIAIMCFKLGEIADFIFEKLDSVIIKNFQNIEEEDKLLYEADLKEYSLLKDIKKYNNI